MFYNVIIEFSVYVGNVGNASLGTLSKGLWKSTKQQYSLKIFSFTYLLMTLLEKYVVCCEALFPTGCLVVTEFSGFL